MSFRNQSVKFKPQIMICNAQGAFKYKFLTTILVTKF
jgi:hypothetical protein